MIQERIELYKQRKEQKKSGQWHYIPFHKHLPRLSKAVPGIIPGTGYIITSGSGVGKSKFYRFLVYTICYEFIKENPDSGLTFKVITNALEESKEEILDFMICSYMYRKHGIYVTPHQLNGYSSRPLGEAVLEKIAESKDYFNDLEKYVIFSDSGNPFGFYLEVREYARQHGTFYDKEDNPLMIPENADWSKYHWVRYEADNPNEIVIIGVDHLTLFNKESGKSTYDTIAHYSQQYVRRIFNLKFNYATFTVQQQNAESDSYSYTSSGRQIVEKLFPTINDLAEVKITARDALVILGLFSPFRYGIKEFNTPASRLIYDVTTLQGCLTSVHILKNRKGGGVGAHIPMFFDPISEMYTELPYTTGAENELEEFYAKARQIQSITS